VCRNELDGLDGGASTHRHLWMWQNDMKKIQNASTSAGCTIANGDVSLLSVGTSTCSHAHSNTGRWDVVMISSRQSHRRNLQISTSDVAGGENGKNASKSRHAVGSSMSPEASQSMKLWTASGTRSSRTRGQCICVTEHLIGFEKLGDFRVSF
jgi:hypothetical protein